MKQRKTQAQKKMHKAQVVARRVAVPWEVSLHCAPTPFSLLRGWQAVSDTGITLRDGLFIWPSDAILLCCKDVGMVENVF